MKASDSQPGMFQNSLFGFSGPFQGESLSGTGARGAASPTDSRTRHTLAAAALLQVFFSSGSASANTELIPSLVSLKQNILGGSGSLRAAFEGLETSHRAEIQSRVGQNLGEILSFSEADSPTAYWTGVLSLGEGLLRRSSPEKINLGAKILGRMMDEGAEVPSELRAKAARALELSSGGGDFGEQFGQMLRNARGMVGWEMVLPMAFAAPLGRCMSYAIKARRVETLARGVRLGWRAHLQAGMTGFLVENLAFSTAYGMLQHGQGLGPDQLWHDTWSAGLMFGVSRAVNLLGQVGFAAAKGLPLGTPLLGASRAGQLLLGNAGGYLGLLSVEGVRLALGGESHGAENIFLHSLGMHLGFTLGGMLGRGALDVFGFHRWEQKLALRMHALSEARGTRTPPQGMPWGRQPVIAGGFFWPHPFGPLSIVERLQLPFVKAESDTKNPPSSERTTLRPIGASSRGEEGGGTEFDVSDAPEAAPLPRNAPPSVPAPTWRPPAAGTDLSPQGTAGAPVSSGVIEYLVQVARSTRNETHFDAMQRLTEFAQGDDPVLATRAAKALEELGGTPDSQEGPATVKPGFKGDSEVDEAPPISTGYDESLRERSTPTAVYRIDSDTGAMSVLDNFDSGIPLEEATVSLRPGAMFPKTGTGVSIAPGSLRPSLPPTLVPKGGEPSTVPSGPLKTSMVPNFTTPPPRPAASPVASSSPPDTTEVDPGWTPPPSPPPPPPASPPAPDPFDSLLESLRPLAPSTDRPLKAPPPKPLRTLVERAKRNPKEHLAPALEQLKNYVVEDGRFAAQALEGLQELAASRMEAAFAFIQLALDHPDLAMEAALKIDLSAFRERIEHPPPGDAAEAPKIASPDQDINMEERYVRLVVALAGLKNDAGVRHETAVADVIGVAWFGTSPIIGAKLRAKIRPSYVKLCEETLRTI